MIAIQISYMMHNISDNNNNNEKYQQRFYFNNNNIFIDGRMKERERGPKQRY